MAKSKGAMLLFIWFDWAAGKNLDAIVRYGISESSKRVIDLANC